MKLTDKQKKWIITHFKNTKNDEIINKIGISHSSLHRFARENGLKKTRQFQSKCQLEASRKGREANERNNWPPKGYRIPKSEENYFKKGSTPEQRLGRKKNMERISKMVASRNKTIKSEKRRVLFGLEQKTKLKVVSSPHSKASYRYTLKKRGYLVERGGKTILWNDNTNRSDIVEHTAQERYKFTIIKQLNS